MKISFLEDCLPVSGSVRHIIEMSNELVRRGGYEVVIYALDKQCSWMHCEAPIRPQKFAALDYHDILIFNNSSVSQWQIMQQARAKKKIFYLVGMTDGKDGQDALKERLSSIDVFRWCLWDTSYSVVSNGTWMRDFLREDFNFNVELALNGINTDMFKPKNSFMRITRRMLKIPTVVASGDLRSRYEFDIIQKAAIQAKKQVKRLSLITYFGKGIPQSNMSTFICQGSVFCDAQNRAGWNNPVAEAMACSVPVVCTDIGGNRDFAIHNETALVVPVGDIEAMSEAIVELVQNREKAKKLAANALEKVRTYTWAASVDQLLEVLEEG